MLRIDLFPFLCYNTSKESEIMKKYLAYILIITILVGSLFGCSASNNMQSFVDAEFVKPEKYAAIVNVSINPSFDIYLDENAVVLAIEPKNEDAKTIDFSSYIGVDLQTAIKDLVGVICENTPINRESVAFTKFVEGEGNIVEVDAVEIINDACADEFAKETVNESMESVLQVRLEDIYGCQCLECNNWYERQWYSYIESVQVNEKKEYEQYMKSWKNDLETMDKNDPIYATSLENYENMTFEKFDFKRNKRIQYYLSDYIGRYGKPIEEVVHEEKIITYRITDCIYTEYTAEEYFEEYPDRREMMEGLQKAICLAVEVYVNGELQGADTQSHCVLYVYQCNEKWYVNGGLIHSHNP